MKISGVYKITNTITGDFYIGSSRNVMQRWVNHKSPSTWKRHSNIRLYQAFQEYGLDKFDFEIIEETNDLKNREQYFIGLLKPEYNIRTAKTGLTVKEYQKQYKKTEKGKNVNRKKITKYFNRLCLYNGEILTFNALWQRFRRAGIEHSAIEAKMYLIENN